MINQILNQMLPWLGIIWAVTAVTGFVFWVKEDIRLMGYLTLLNLISILFCCALPVVGLWVTWGKVKHLFSWFIDWAADFKLYRTAKYKKNQQPRKESQP